MDFRTCPDCKASVLEDDVDDCPFCGASMSGKSKPSAPKKPAPPAPGSKPAARPGSPAEQKKSDPKSPATPGKSPPGRPAQRPAPAGKEKDAASDDPFDVDTSAMRRAIKLSPTATKVKTVEVVCPMCETPGFMAPTDAGKDVHCCNASCMVPVFKTKKPKVEEVKKEEPKGNRMLLIGGGVGAVAVLGGVAWFLTSAPAPTTLPPADFAPQVEKKNDANLVPDNAVVKHVEKPLNSVAEVKAKSLELITDRARQRERNRHPEYGFQQAAESFAQSGDLTKAQEQIRRLQAAGPGIAYLQIQPLVEVGWQQLKAGKKAEAVTTAQAAFAKAKNLPRSVRKTHDASVALAALLIAVELPEDAKTLLDQEQDYGVRGVVSLFWRTAIDGRTFNVNDEAGFAWHASIPDPTRMGTVESLVTHQQLDAALGFAATTGNVATQSSCRAAWAGRLMLLQPTTAVDKVTQAIEAGKFDAVTQCQMWAAVADAARFLKNSAVSSASLQKAQAALDLIEAPAVRPYPSKREIYESDGKPHLGLPDPAPSHAAAVAAVNVAVAQINLGDRDAGWASLQRALEFFRAMGPSAAATRASVEECQRQEGLVRSELASLLKLPNNENSIRIPFSRYRTQCGHLNREAERFLQLRVDVLRAAAVAGLPQQVWDYCLEKSRVSNLAQRDPYLESSVPSMIYCLAEAQGLSELLASVKAAFTEKALTPDPLDQIFATASEDVTKARFKAASSILERGYRSNLAKRFPDQLDLIALRIGGRIQSAQSAEVVISFIQGLFDQLIQEDLFLLLAGHAMETGTSPQLWRMTANSRDLEALEFVSLYRGFIAGNDPTPAAPPQPTPQKK